MVFFCPSSKHLLNTKNKYFCENSCTEEAKISDHNNFITVASTSKYIQDYSKHKFFRDFKVLMSKILKPSCVQILTKNKFIAIIASI